MATEYGVVQVGLMEGAGTTLGEAVSISKVNWLVCLVIVLEKGQAYFEPDCVSGTPPMMGNITKENAKRIIVPTSFPTE